MNEANYCHYSDLPSPLAYMEPEINSVVLKENENKVLPALTLQLNITNE